MSLTLDGTQGVSKVAPGGVEASDLVQDTGSWGFKNKLINGCCRVAQRGDVAVTNNTWKYGGADRICFAPTGFTTVTGNIHQYPEASALLSASGCGQGAYISTTGSGTLSFQQRVEARNCRMLNGKKITASVLVFQNSGVTVNASIIINKANTLDTFSAQTALVSTGNVSVPSGTYVRLSATVLLGASDASNGLAVIANFAVGAVTNKDFVTMDWQLEEGPAVTPFEMRPMSYEIHLCQRYYEKSFDIGQAPINGGSGSFGISAGVTCAVSFNSLGSGHIRYKVSKKSQPTITPYGDVNGYWAIWNGSAITFHQYAFGTPYVGTEGFALSQQAVGALSAVAGHWTADAEL